MNDRFFVLIYGTSIKGKDFTHFSSYHNVQDVVDLVRDWLERFCGMDCYTPRREAASAPPTAGSCRKPPSSAPRSPPRRNWPATTAFTTTRAWGSSTSSSPRCMTPSLPSSSGWA